MIQAISSIEVKKKNNYTNIKTKSVAQVSFSGINASKIGKEVLGDAGSKLSKKTSKFGEEALNFVKNIFRRLKKKEELPYSEKPITFDIETNEKMDNESKKNAEKFVQFDANRKDTLQKINDSGHTPRPGDIDPYGNPTIEGQEKIDHPTSLANKMAFSGNYEEKVQEKIDRIQHSPWLTEQEKNEELIKLSGNNISVADIDADGHLTFNGQHKIDNPDSGYNHPVRSSIEEGNGNASEIDKIQSSPWLTADEKAKEIAEIKHGIINPQEQHIDDNVRHEEVYDNDHHHLINDNLIDNPPDLTQEHESFLTKLFDSIFGNGDDINT